MNELFIIIVILFVLWFINNNTASKKSNKPVKEDFNLLNNWRIGSWNLLIAPPNATVSECSSETCSMIGQVCTSDVAEKKWWF